MFLQDNAPAFLNSHLSSSLSEYICAEKKKNIGGSPLFLFRNLSQYKERRGYHSRGLDIIFL